MGTVRIVGGIWRRTPVEVGSRSGLRPTSERVRETLFDWLGHLVETLDGRRVLDLFAGSGALGLEAASRGATVVDWVEADRTSVAAIRRTLVRLKAGSGLRVHVGDAFAFLEAGGDDYDLIFIDPPFAEDLQEKALRRALGRLAPNGLLYVESPSKTLGEEVLARFGLVRMRSGLAGEAAYELLARAGDGMALLAKPSKEEKKRARRAAKEAK